MARSLIVGGKHGGLPWRFFAEGDALVEASVALHLAAALGTSTKLEEEWWGKVG